MASEYKIFQHIENMKKKIEQLEKELSDEKKRLETSLKLIADVEALERKIEADREQFCKADIDFLMTYCQSRAKAKRLLFEIKSGKFEK